MVVAAHPITVNGGHCWFMGGEADSDDELRRMVRTHHKRGADLIKVMSTGGFMTTGSAPWYAQFTRAQLAVIVEEAGRVDKPVAAHAHGIEGIYRAVEAGVTTLEHCSFVTETNERRFDEPLAAMIAERGIFVCPTINVNAPYVAELTGIVVGEHLKAMHEMGVRLIAGTDAGIDNTPHHQYVGCSPRQPGDGRPRRNAGDLRELRGVVSGLAGGRSPVLVRGPWVRAVARRATSIVRTTPPPPRLPAALS
jgi:imidazolonepropionase-like amidohydrolase